MTDFEAMKRMKLMADGGTNFSEESQAACKIALEALQERRTLEAELHSYKAMLETAKEHIAQQKAENNRLALENDDLRVQVEIYDKDDLKWADSEIEKLKQELQKFEQDNVNLAWGLAKVARERDAAVADFKACVMTTEHEDYALAGCKYCQRNDLCVPDLCDFKWRGVKEETT